MAVKGTWTDVVIQAPLFIGPPALSALADQIIPVTVLNFHLHTSNSFARYLEVLTGYKVINVRLYVGEKGLPGAAGTIPGLSGFPGENQIVRKQDPGLPDR